MSIGNELLIVLSDYTGGYKLMRLRNRGYTGPANFRALKKKIDAKTNMLSVTLHRLKKKGFVENDEGVWRITQNGSKYLKEKLLFQSSRGFCSVRKKRKGCDYCI